MKKKIKLISISLLIGITLLLNPHQAMAPTTDHDTLVIGIGWLPSIDDREMYIIRPNNIPWTYDVNLVFFQYTAALGMLAPGDWADVLPGIAGNWTHNENLTEWTYTLRENLLFHDGTPINAKAVEYSFYVKDVVFSLLGEELPLNFSYVKENYPEWHNISISFPENDPTGSGLIITFRFDSPTPPDHEWDFGSQYRLLVPYGSHGEYTDSPETCKRKIDDFFREPVSAGPYKLNKWEKNDFVLLEQFDDWFGWGQTLTSIHGKQYTFPTKDRAFKFLNFTVLPLTADPRQVLLSGNIDVISTESYDSIEEDTDEKLTEINQTKGFSVQVKPMVNRAELGINTQGNYPTVFGGLGNYPLSKTWFRQAVSHAINRTRIVDKAYQGYAFVSDSIFPDNIGNYFPDIDTSDYYNYSQGLAMAESILDSQGYTALGFSEEPNNRFGYGPYLNETKDEGEDEDRSRGHHFKMFIGSDRPIITTRSQIITDDLRKAGIYVDIVSGSSPGDPGSKYNTSCVELGIRDPKYNGSDLDFIAYDWPYGYGFPHTYVGGGWLYWGDGYSNVVWYLYGEIMKSWFSNDYEVLLAKMRGGYGFLEDLPYADIPPDAPFPAPEVRNTDTQYTEACEDAGYLLSQELPFIPLVWNPAITLKKNNVKKFLVGGDAFEFHGAYAYWESGDESTSRPTKSRATHTKPTTPETNPILDYFLLINVCLIFLVYRSKKK